MVRKINKIQKETKIINKNTKNLRGNPNRKKP